MKRIIALLLILSVLLISLLGMVSCVETKHDTDGEQGQTPGGDQENGENNTDGDNNQGSKDECADDSHIDANNDDYCDSCSKYVVVVVDFYVLNDLHGKFCDTDTQSGIDELATYLKKMKATDDNAIFLASGDMWQGTAESNLTGGIILTEWMNSLDFAAMTLGNHDFDWGEEAIRENLEASEFPFLAINVYDLSTGKHGLFFKYFFGVLKKRPKNAIIIPKE